MLVVPNDTAAIVFHRAPQLERISSGRSSCRFSTLYTCYNIQVHRVRSAYKQALYAWCNEFVQAAWLRRHTSPILTLKLRFIHSSHYFSWICLNLIFTFPSTTCTLFRPFSENYSAIIGWRTVLSMSRETPPGCILHFTTIIVLQFVLHARDVFSKQIWRPSWENVSLLPTF